jgi:hypothetical protein
MQDPSALMWVPPMKKIFNVIRHYHSPSAKHLASPYELEYEMISRPEERKQSSATINTPPVPQHDCEQSPSDVPPAEPCLAPANRANEDNEIRYQALTDFLDDFADPVKEDTNEVPKYDEEVIPSPSNARISSLFAITP